MQIIYFITLFTTFIYNYISICNYNYFKMSHDVPEINKFTDYELYIISSHISIIYILFNFYYFTNYYIYFIILISIYCILLDRILNRDIVITFFDKLLNNWQYTIFRTFLFTHIFNIGYIYCICKLYILI